MIWGIFCTSKILYTKDFRHFCTLRRCEIDIYAILCTCKGCVLNICAIFCTCKTLYTKYVRHFVYFYVFTVSIYIGATSVGCLLSGIIMDLWGRRLTVQIAVSCVCIGWLLIATATTHPLMFVGRTLCGFGKGVSSPAITVSNKHRKERHMVKM